MTIHLHRGDLPAGLSFGNMVAIDTETMGLVHNRDRLCLVQLSAGDGDCHIVQFQRRNGRVDYEAPNLKALLADHQVVKLFHFARFDLAAIGLYLGISCRPVWCTRTASKLVRTFTDRHGLKDLCRELIGVEISKQEQSSDWGAPDLTDAQLKYAASDVLHLHQLARILDDMLKREGRQHLASACFDFLPARAELDLAGWPETDIFAH